MALQPRRQGGPGKGSAGDLMGAGFQIAGSILLFLFLGQWLDRRLGTHGLLTVAGVFVGFAASFYSLYRRMNAPTGRGPKDGDA